MIHWINELVFEYDQVEWSVLICAATHKWIPSCGLQRRVECPANCNAKLSTTSYTRPYIRSSKTTIHNSFLLPTDYIFYSKLYIRIAHNIATCRINFTHRTTLISLTNRNHIGENINYPTYPTPRHKWTVQKRPLIIFYCVFHECLFRSGLKELRDRLE